jgi:NDP-sugar pyrophosphorylase family protein
LKNIFANAFRNNTMVIMAGGKGTRLRPHTDNCPKPLLPIGGKPILEHIIARAKVSGFHRFVISLHYLGDMIKAHFGDGTKLGVSISYIEETIPMGTAGALSLLRDRLSAPFVVTNGDVLTDIDYGRLLDFHMSYAAQATMAVREHEWQNPFGVVRTDGIDIVTFEEKPIVKSHINAGVYALNPAVIQLLSPIDYCDMPTLFSLAKENSLRTIAYPMHEPWLDIGRPSDFEHAQSLSI